MSAVMFVKDLNKVAAFYESVFGIRSSHGDADHVILVVGTFELVIHQIPRHLLGAAGMSPPERRERAAIRLDFPVQDITHARREAIHLGGVIDELPPSWAGTDTSFFLGHDPEGNVFGAKIETTTR